jgi:hypothetical protein
MVSSASLETHANVAGTADWCRAAGQGKAKKEPPFPAAFEVDNREASNRVDRSHSVSKEDDESHT